MSVITYKCPNCGADLQFDPSSQQCKCNFCLSTFSNEELKSLSTQKKYETPPQEVLEDATDNLSDSTSQNKTFLYTCPSCGAEIITDETTSATICCYCHNPIILSKQLEGEFRPSKVIPFKITSKQAVEAFLSWRKKHWFLPDDFSSPSQLEKITGIYIPYWLVDCQVSGQMHAKGKKISTWVSGDYRYTKTDSYAVYRAADMDFNHIPHDASKKADDVVMDSIGPFNYNELTDFSYSYLSGFLAEKYDVTKEDIYPTIKARVEKSVNRTLENSIQGYTTTSVHKSRVNFHKTKFHYTLMPTWILTYIYKGETYLFAMNGQTGKAYGALPICRKKLMMCFGISFAILFTICLIGGFCL